MRIETINNQLELVMQDDGRVTVDMNRPIFELERVPFDASDLTPRREGGFALWPIDVGEGPAGKGAEFRVVVNDASLIVRGQEIRLPASLDEPEAAAPPSASEAVADETHEEVDAMAARGQLPVGFDPGAG